MRINYYNVLFHFFYFFYIGIAFSIAFFNFAGISVTKEISATTRMILDSIRTIVIWAFSLQFKWQDFHYLQVIKLYSRVNNI